MPLENLPPNVVDDSIIETEWGNQTSVAIRTLGSWMEQSGDMLVAEAGNRITRLAGRPNSHIVYDSGSFPRVVDYIAPESWALEGNSDRVPIEKTIRQMAIHTGATLPSVGPQGQLLLINVPPNAIVQQDIGANDYGFNLAARGGLVTLGRLPTGDTLTTRVWDTGTESVTFTGRGVNLSGSGDTVPFYQQSIARSSNRGFVGLEDGFVWQFDIAGSGQWTESGSRVKLGEDNRGISLDADDSRVWHFADSMNNAGVVVATTITVRSSDFRLANTRTEFQVDVTNAIAMGVTNTRAYVLDLVDRGSIDTRTGFNEASGVRYELIELEKNGNELARIPFTLDGVWVDSQSTSLSVPQLYDITASGDRVWIYYRRSDAGSGR